MTPVAKPLYKQLPYQIFEIAPAESFRVPGKPCIDQPRIYENAKTLLFYLLMQAQMFAYLLSGLLEPDIASI